MSGQYQERERREHLKQYREKNKDKINESRRRKCAENKEQINQKKKEYRKAQKAKNISV